MLRFSEMSFRYADWIFENLSAEIAATNVGITGRNGAGKTTLLRLLDGQLTPQRGSLRVGGVPYLVDYDLSMYKSFWAEDIVHLCSSLSSFDTANADALIDELFLREYMGTPIGALSKGTSKKVSNLMALMSTADVLLLDEPFESVDPESNANLVALLREHGGTKVIVSHDSSFLAQSADIVYRVSGRTLERVE